MEYRAVDRDRHQFAEDDVDPASEPVDVLDLAFATL
jgi:hypothetical protein